jgi:ribosome biogenesis protein BMS1
VAVHGSAKSGKSTLIRSLVRYYTGHKIAELKGPITIRTGKNQRLTLIECENSATSMIDLSKIADFVLLIIDASVGLEMETFEFLSLLKCHGFPNVMGILNHLDFYKDSKQLRKTRKKYKKRFEYEVGGNSKLFHIVGCSGDLYPKRDIVNLARSISSVKPAVIPWRLQHPYLLSDRWEVAKDSNYQDEDLAPVAFYGYIRGASYRMNSRLHLVGLGDFDVTSFEMIDDPCP